jgi:exopolysaccharide biosynthesis polyprenyl glycosylphosphotransferase
MNSSTSNSNQTSLTSNQVYSKLITYLQGKRILSFEISDRKYLLYTVDILLIFLANSIYNLDLYPDLGFKELITLHYPYFISIALLWSFFSYVFDLYNLENVSKIYETLKYVFITVILSVVGYVFIPWFTPNGVSRLSLILFFVNLVVSLMTWRYVYARLLNKPLFLKRIIIVGSGWTSKALIDVFADGDIFNYHLGYKIVSVIDKDSKIKSYKGIRITNGTSSLSKLTKRLKVDEIIVDESASNDTNFISLRELTDCSKKGINVTSLPDFYESLTGRVLVQKTGRDFSLSFPYNRNQFKKAYLFFSRSIDITFGIVGVLICGLLLPFVYIANLFGSRGPLFYSQKRVGLFGKPFKIIKLRSMVIDAEKNGATWAQQNDVRITRVGKFLRRCRIDELPQAWSVLKGDMSLIGPRPERPVFVEQLIEEIPFYDTRHLVKPGITGWAQAIYKYGSNTEDALMKVQYDLYYIKNRSIMLDVKVLLKTISVVVRFKGM